MNLTSGQDFRNTGGIANTGVLQVKNLKTGLPSVVNGTFEVIGRNQTIPPVQFSNLILNGQSRHSTAAGNLAITGTLTIAGNDTLSVDQSSVVGLMGTLADNGMLIGKIRKTDTLGSPPYQSHFGNLGLRLTGSGASPGITTVTRGSQLVSTGNGQFSIARYFDVAPQNSHVTAQLTFSYAAPDLMGQNASQLELWRSLDGGVTWRKQKTQNDAPNLALSTLQSHALNGRWTASDPAHPLGSLDYEWVPQTLVASSGNGSTAPVNAVASPFVLTVIDAFGNPLSDVPVSFAITTAPPGALGQSLSVLNAMTDANGEAATVLTLGNLTGTYTVTAQTPQTPNISTTFTVTATSGTPQGPVAQTISPISGNNQSGLVKAALEHPLVVIVADANGISVAGVPVSWTIKSVPTGASGIATGYSLSSTNTTTDVSGRAAVSFRLGDIPGSYTVEARSAGLSGSPIVFKAQALPEAARTPASLVLSSGNYQQARISNALPSPFEVTVLDASGKPLPGVSVAFRFDLQNIPDGATGYRLSDTTGVTNANGLARATLTLGNKVGQYNVSASVPGLAGGALRFTAIALPGAPALITNSSGNNQTKESGSILDLPLAVRVFDSGANQVPGVRVQFAIASAPQGAGGQYISVSESSTDETGLASTYLKLGDTRGEYRVTATVDNLPPIVFSAYAEALMGDLNWDTEINIADLTMVIEHIRGRITFTGPDSAKADVNSDGAIDNRDVSWMEQYLLAEVESFNLRNAGNPSATAPSNADSVGLVQGGIDLTNFGGRVLLTNDVPVLGIQLTIRFRNTVPSGLDTASIIFSRAKMMTLPMNIRDREVRILAYNLQNEPIEPGSGSLFRLNWDFIDIGEIESTELITSTGKTIHAALKGSLAVLNDPVVPQSFTLDQNYPNPFNPTTTIEFEVPDTREGTMNLALEVYNQLGQKVKTLAHQEYEAGRHGAIWDATDEAGSRVASGLYYYRLVSKNYQSSKRMILLK